eukprot:comp22581_c0_seq1/m.34503 comp22581_c0_seq1/g.34503  ORF comp22581_c0_seq1/g.34503 comp22581_c0_seq1/m.34503 type:complete len:272 (-) comp22581_c0_seq1:317-1132(-)
MAFVQVSRRLFSSTAAMFTAKRLSGRVAVVTASTAGIGFSVARRLGQEGAKVVISSRKQANVDEACKKLQEEGLEVHGIACHVGSSEQRKKLIEEAVGKYGGLDILVSNAAVNPHYGPVLTCTEDQWDKIFDTNVKASFFLAKEAYPHLAKSSNGPNIVFISSIAGYEPLQGLGAYSVSKTALLSFPMVLGKELGPTIRVNGVAPGIVKTNFSQALWEDEKLMKKMTAVVPLKALAVPDQIASAVAFLVSDDASYMTGETITVAGGMRSRL